jgi:hypothetical protein
MHGKGYKGVGRLVENYLSRRFFYELPIGEKFRWKNNLYIKRDVERAFEVKTNMSWVFEIHYIVGVKTEETFEDYMVRKIYE